MNNIVAVCTQNSDIIDSCFSILAIRRRKKLKMMHNGETLGYATIELLKIETAAEALRAPFPLCGCSKSRITGTRHNRTFLAFNKTPLVKILCIPRGFIRPGSSLGTSWLPWRSWFRKGNPVPNLWILLRNEFYNLRPELFGYLIHTPSELCPEWSPITTKGIRAQVLDCDWIGEFTEGAPVTARFPTFFAREIIMFQRIGITRCLGEVANVAFWAGSPDKGQIVFMRILMAGPPITLLMRIGRVENYSIISIFIQVIIWTGDPEPVSAFFISHVPALMLVD